MLLNQVCCVRELCAEQMDLEADRDDFANQSFTLTLADFEDLVWYLGMFGGDRFYWCTEFSLFNGVHTLLPMTYSLTPGNLTVSYGITGLAFGYDALKINPHVPSVAPGFALPADEADLIDKPAQNRWFHLRLTFSYSGLLIPPLGSQALMDGWKGGSETVFPPNSPPLNGPVWRAQCVPTDDDPWISNGQFGQSSATQLFCSTLATTFATRNGRMDLVRNV